MSDADRRRWYAEDRVAEQLVTAHDPGAIVVRLDVPGWRLHPTDDTVGVAVGQGTRPADLAAALGQLARHDTVQVVLPANGVATADWATAAGPWQVTGHRRIADAVELTLTRNGSGPAPAVLAALHHREAPVPRTRVPAPWRIRLDDDRARAWFADLHTADERASLTVGTSGDPAADQAMRRLVLVEDGDPPPEGATLAVTDDPVGAADGVRVVARPVDLGRYSPVGCSPRGADRAPVLPLHPDAPPDGVAAARRLAEGAADRLGAGQHTELPLPPDGLPPGSMVVELRAATALFDHSQLHPGPAAHARWLLATVASGIPVVPLAPLPGAVATLLGDPVARELAATDVADVADPDLRERTSVRQRRVVLDGHTADARLHQLADDLGLLAPRARPVTIVLATNREAFLPQALQQIAQQDWPTLEVVVVTNGAQPPPSLRRLVDEHLAHLPVEIRHVDHEWTLGDALNVGVDLAGGELVTKFDDDDWYAPGHVTELVHALAYSGADVVGRAAEFVHVADADVTLRRWGQGGERYSPTLAGGTLMFSRQVWRDIAGFPRVNLGEDRGIVEDVRAAGGTTYRCHPFGYLLHRHGQHAWTVDDQAFLDAAVATRPGRDHDWTLT